MQIGVPAILIVIGAGLILLGRYVRNSRTIDDNARLTMAVTGPRLRRREQRRQLRNDPELLRAVMRSWVDIPMYGLGALVILVGLYGLIRALISI